MQYELALKSIQPDFMCFGIRNISCHLHAIWNCCSKCEKRVCISKVISAIRNLKIGCHQPLWQLSTFYIKVVRVVHVMSQFIWSLIHVTGPRSAVGNVSGYRCVSDCRSRGPEFDPGLVPYFRGDWSWNNFYGRSPPSADLFKKGCCQLQAKVCAQITG